MGDTEARGGPAAVQEGIAHKCSLGMPEVKHGQQSGAGPRALMVAPANSRTSAQAEGHATTLDI